MPDVRVDEVAGSDVDTLCDVIDASRCAGRSADPVPATWEETRTALSAAIGATGGLLCRVDGEPAGGLVFDDTDSGLALHRVSVVPPFRPVEVVSALVCAAEEVAAGRSHDDVLLLSANQLEAAVEVCVARGYAELSSNGGALALGKALPVTLDTADADGTREVGRRLAKLTRAGDLVVLVGELGAGKTTLTQGIGAGLEVRGDVTSPTYVISRVHQPRGDGPFLLHVDAYRIGAGAELEDLDLDAFVEEAVTVVEWGEGVAETLADHRLVVRLSRGRGNEAGGTRRITVTPVGARWFGAGVRSALVGTALLGPALLGPGS